MLIDKTCNSGQVTSSSYLPSSALNTCEKTPIPDSSTFTTSEHMDQPSPVSRFTYLTSNDYDDDDPDDPEFDVMAELDKICKEDFFDELRDDRAVRVSKMEAKTLHQDLHELLVDDIESPFRPRNSHFSSNLRNRRLSTSCSSVGASTNAVTFSSPISSRSSSSSSSSSRSRSPLSFGLSATQARLLEDRPLPSCPVCELTLVSCFCSFRNTRTASGSHSATASNAASAPNTGFAAISASSGVRNDSLHLPALSGSLLTTVDEWPRWVAPGRRRRAAALSALAVNSATFASQLTKSPR
ncbi:unnamed protein product [Protopolystoma xenopodis]|uniref:Uncharacterized protein n=1 Tax=Protopolystoma xenopodis TaxID=117903 RepID=A0A3S5ARR3_9PLAT|nr:unnamed protein product [Protopolystoma xenopodis]